MGSPVGTRLVTSLQSRNRSGVPDGSRIGGRTPLVAACMLRSKFNIDVVRMLLDAKASVDQKAADAGESFPLMAALHNQPCVELLLARGANVSQTDREEYSPLLAACEWGLPEATAALLEHGADTAFQGREAGYTPLVAAAIRGNPKCVQQLLGAGVDPRSPERCFKEGAPGIKSVPRDGLDALGWAKHLLRHAPAGMKADFETVVRMLGEFEEFFHDACALGVVTESQLDALVKRVADAPPAERCELRREAMNEHWKLVAEAEAEQMRAKTKVLVAQRIAFESAPKAVDAKDLCPQETIPVFGGRARIRGLTKAAHLNGEVGSIVNFNADGKRRFGLRLKAGKVLSILPANLTAVDKLGLEGCTSTSAEVCDALRTAFASVGLGSLTVVDWTALAADPEVDPANLHEMGFKSYLLNAECEARAEQPSRAYYVQRTAETESFFLTIRELMEADTAGCCTMPWVLYLDSHPMNVLTPSGDFSADVAYITRTCANSLAPDLSCPICMETLSLKESPSQLPCAHFMCVACMKKLYPIGQEGGLKCPVCQRDHSTYALVEVHDAPGGVAVAEVR